MEEVGEATPPWKGKLEDLEEETLKDAMNKIHDYLDKHHYSLSNSEKQPWVNWWWDLDNALFEKEEAIAKMEQSTESSVLESSLSKIDVDMTPEDMLLFNGLKNIRSKLECIGYKLDTLSCLEFVAVSKVNKHGPCTYKWTYSRGKSSITIHSDSFILGSHCYIEEVFYIGYSKSLATRTSIIVNEDITKVIQSDTWKKAEERGWSPNYKNFICSK